ncbi:MAG: CYTH domain-containing protein [Candidatus Wildermuthbacteria bacterium]|nr:CYTH domain-containing protein [Candidatus Wildermuthbacteria bacterium]
MIEVEKKFILEQKDKEKLLEGAEFLHEKIIRDAYYDTKSFALAKKDWWLRERNGAFELKISTRIPQKQENFAPTQYRELETEEEIRKALDLSSKSPFLQALEEQGYLKAFALETIRKKYEKQGFTVDFDIVDYGYELAEIELMVDQESQIAEAEKRIWDFATSQGLSFNGEQRGKVLEYLRRYEPSQYQEILDAWGEKIA